MAEPAYPPARIVAAKAKAHFARHMAAARARGETGLAVVPEAETIEAVVDAAFWASLRREEGYTPTISLAFLAPEEAPRPLAFLPSLPLTPDGLARLAP